MKVIKTCLGIVSILMMLSACNNVDHPIAGHTYVNDNRIWMRQYGQPYKSSGMVTHLHFYSTGKMEMEVRLYEDGSSTPHMTKTYKHFNYDIEGNTIVVSHDYSVYWKSTVRGTEDERYVYNSKENSLMSTNGTLYDFLY